MTRVSLSCVQCATFPQGSDVYTTLGIQALLPPLVEVPALLRRMALNDRGAVSMLLNMAHCILHRARQPDAPPGWAQLPDLGGPLVALSAVRVGEGTDFAHILLDSEEHRMLTLHENTAIARHLARDWDEWSALPSQDRATFLDYGRAKWQHEDMFYDCLPMPCHERIGVPGPAETDAQRATGVSMLDVKSEADAAAFSWDTLPFGFMNMLINFIQVVEANIECTTGATSTRRNWSSIRHYNFVRSRLEALIGQSNADNGVHTERIRRLREHGMAAAVFFQHLDAHTHGMSEEAVAAIVAQEQALAYARHLAQQLEQYNDGALSDVEAAGRCAALDAALLALHPDMVKRVNHVKQLFDYVADLRGPVHFDVETRRLYANILGDPLVFQRLGLDSNRSPHLVTVQFHKSTQWRARMFRDIFGPKSAVLYNFGGADPGFNVIQTITQLYPYVVFALGDGAHKHISSVSRRRYVPRGCGVA